MDKQTLKQGAALLAVFVLGGVITHFLIDGSIKHLGHQPAIAAAPVVVTAPPVAPAAAKS